MTAFRQFKVLLAGAAAVAMIGSAMAQGNPPNPAVKNAPEGAGQQSTQGTPMGMTGTPSGAPMTNNSTSRSTTTRNTGTGMGTANTGNTGSGAAMGANSTSADTSMSASAMPAKRMNRKARSDRN